MAAFNQNLTTSFRPGDEFSRSYRGDLPTQKSQFCGLLFFQHHDDSFIFNSEFSLRNINIR